jgi:hypothetical protein
MFVVHVTSRGGKRNRGGSGLGNPRRRAELATVRIVFMASRRRRRRSSSRKRNRGGGGLGNPRRRAELATVRFVFVFDVDCALTASQNNSA